MLIFESLNAKLAHEVHEAVVHSYLSGFNLRNYDTCDEVHPVDDFEQVPCPASS